MPYQVLLPTSQRLRDRYQRQTLRHRSNTTLAAIQNRWQGLAWIIHEHLIEEAACRTLTRSVSEGERHKTR